MPAAGECGDACLPEVGVAAGHDEVEEGEIEVHVERGPVAGHPAPTAETHRGYLVAAHVEPGRALAPHRGDPQTAEEHYQHLLQGAYVGGEISPGNGNDGVADQLAGGVEGGLTAPLGLHHLDAAPGTRSAKRRGAQVLGSGPGAESDHGLVLEQQKHARHPSVGDRFAEAALQFLHGLIRGDAEIEHRQQEARGPRGICRIGGVVAPCVHDLIPRRP